MADDTTEERALIQPITQASLDLAVELKERYRLTLVNARHWLERDGDVAYVVRLIDEALRGE